MLMLLSVHVTGILFLVLVGNSAASIGVTHSYSSHPFLCALAPIGSHSLVEVIELYYKHRIPATCLATITYVYTQLHSTVTNFSAGNKLRSVLDFTLLIALTLATLFSCASPYVCLQELIVHQLVCL